MWHIVVPAGKVKKRHGVEPLERVSAVVITWCSMIPARSSQPLLSAETPAVIEAVQYKHVDSILDLSVATITDLVSSKHVHP